MTELLMENKGTAEGLKKQVGPGYRELSFDERFSLLLDKEQLHRENTQLRILSSKARFRHPSACIEKVDFRTRRGLMKESLIRLAQNEWIRLHQNVLLIGSTGIGKTYLACALGNSAIRQGISTRCVRIPRLMQELKIARADGSYVKILQRLQRVQLLIIDDFGLSPFTDDARRDLLEIMEDRHQVRSTLIASQLPLELWHETIGDPTFADAICDRIIHNAHKLILAGESMRKTQGGLTEGRTL
jgi:DNA replication protein DnaC